MAKSNTASSPAASAAQPAASAAQPGENTKSFQSLKMLQSKQSSKIGQFKVIVFKPWVDTYSYQWEGKTRETTAWRGTLVDAQDPTVYCSGEYKLTAKNKAAYDKHVQAHKAGTQLIMRNISLVESAKTQYMSRSARVTVNMASTNLTGIFGQSSAAQPVPTTTIAQICSGPQAKPHTRTDPNEDDDPAKSLQRHVTNS